MGWIANSLFLNTVQNNNNNKLGFTFWFIKTYLKKPKTKTKTYFLFVLYHFCQR